MSQSAGESATTGASTTSTTALPSLQFHTLAGSKLRSKYACSFQEHVAAPVSSTAQSQLAKMGWKEGESLGKRKNGITTHIRVKKRDDQQAGLGTEKVKAQKMQQEHANQWWKESFADTLAKLDKKNKKKKGSSSSKKRKIFSDEELFEATGGARFGMRAGKTRNLAKWRRTESNMSNSSGQDGVEEQTKVEEPLVVSEEASVNSVIVEDQKKEKKDKKKKKKDKKEKRKKSGDEKETASNEVLQDDNEDALQEEKKKSKKDKKNKKTKKDKKRKRPEE